MTDTLSDALLPYLFEALYCMDAAERRRSHWVMNTEWFLEVRKLGDSMGHPVLMPPWSPSAPAMLLGLPVEIRTDGGAPHLELSP
jgi:HK97 family phage major capsid protein